MKLYKFDNISEETRSFIEEAYIRFAFEYQYKPLTIDEDTLDLSRIEYKYDFIQYCLEYLEDYKD